MSITTPQQLFLHELGDIYDAEQRIEHMLPDLIAECAGADMAQALKEHLQETRYQIDNIARCFDILGAHPQRTVCGIIEGMQREHDNFIREQPVGSLLTLFDISRMAQTEQFEMTAYHMLIAHCTLMGQQQCVTLLQENLRQEEAMAQKVAQFSQQFCDQIIGQWNHTAPTSEDFMPMN